MVPATIHETLPAKEAVGAVVGSISGGGGALGGVDEDRGGHEVILLLGAGNLRGIESARRGKSAPYEASQLHASSSTQVCSMRH